jgi:hypothetical protein
MPATISDGDIEVFLQRNAPEYPSQISLIQAAVRLLWPNGPPSGGAERVVRVCLDQRLGGSSPVASASHLPGQVMLLR